VGMKCQQICKISRKKT